MRQKVFSSVTANGITRFPWAANEPPRADALRGLIEACPPTGVSHIPFASIGYHQRFALLY